MVLLVSRCISVCPSMTSFAGFVASRVIETVLEESIRCGRFESINGARGTMRNPSTRGSTMGPPALMAYAVEPVGSTDYQSVCLNLSATVPLIWMRNFSIFAGRSVIINA
jgi:hypothetical protein